MTFPAPVIDFFYAFWGCWIQMLGNCHKHGRVIGFRVAWCSFSLRKMVGTNISSLRARSRIETVTSTFGYLLSPNFGQFFVCGPLVKGELLNVGSFHNVIGITLVVISVTNCAPSIIWHSKQSSYSSGAMKS